MKGHQRGAESFLLIKTSERDKISKKANQKSPFTRKTFLYNFDPLKPHFYIIKLGFTGAYIIFLISAENTGCGYPLELPCRGGSNEYPQSMF